MESLLREWLVFLEGASWLTSSQSVFHVCKYISFFQKYGGKKVCKYISFFQKYGGKMEGLAERGLRCIPVDLISICFPGGLSSKDKLSAHLFSDIFGFLHQEHFIFVEEVVKIHKHFLRED